MLLLPDTYSLSFHVRAERFFLAAKGRPKLQVFPFHGRKSVKALLYLANIDVSHQCQIFKLSKTRVLPSIPRIDGVRQPRGAVKRQHLVVIIARNKQQAGRGKRQR